MKEEEEDGQTALVLDDPSTPEPADFWLHPCDCAPSDWGPELPVDPQMFEHLPAASDNNFIPVPYSIVTGQLTCPSRQLLQGGLGIHFQSEEQVLEPSDCEARCREEETCAFFWHGSQHGAATCRLFSGCDNLVREFSLEGDLKAMPRESSCSVADAAKCWATSLRRSFLTMAFDPTSSLRPDTEQGKSLNLPPQPSEPTAEGMVAWFKSEHAGSVWPSSVGGFEGRSRQNSVYRKVEAGWGADRPVTYLSGDTSSRYRFGDILKPTYTLCSVTRYTSNDNTNRILETNGANWLHGHCCGKPGYTYHDGFLTDEHAPLSKSLDWLVMCSTNGGKRTYSSAMGNTTVNIAKKEGKKFSKAMPLMVNEEEHGSKSNYGVMEIITWDRALSEEEMQVSMEYLKWKLRAGAVLEVSEHLAREPENNFDSFGVQNMNDIEDQTFDVSIANGYSAQLSGWTNTRAYGRGFLRNKDGKATAVVKGLTPAAMYVYELFQVGERTDTSWVGQCKISVNHGRESRAHSGDLVIPRFSGVATANPRGEIVFEFERISSHVYISGISVAAVGPSGAVSKPADPPLQVQEQGLHEVMPRKFLSSCWDSRVTETSKRFAGE
ncbi:unnamed protein product [Symbiodinium sp. CCMP2592]|nr:unnamed protein product [Symbiodinium sp. CCMP2592]